MAKTCNKTNDECGDFCNEFDYMSHFLLLCSYVKEFWNYF